MRKPGFIIFIVIFSLLIGWIFFQVINKDEPIHDAQTDFRSWFWEKRGLDIAVQMLLLFAGALGIAAILPVEDEDDE